MGLGKLSLTERPKDTPTKQAAASVGQCELMYTYNKEFGQYNHTVAQILLTVLDLQDEQHNRNFQNTISRLLELGTLPIINENDSVATEELEIDNDTMGALVATAVEAELLVLLSDIEGLYTADPHRNPDAELIHEVRALTPEIFALAGGKGSSLGTGGMATKLKAAWMVNQAGIDMVIANGAKPELLYDILDGKAVGTRFYGQIGREQA
jgi:glutamate 5-kinase